MDSVRPEEGLLLVRAFARLDALALGFAAGTVLAGFLAFATAWLVVKGGPVVGPNLGLLAHYFPGYSVTWVGVAVGAAYGFVTGFVVGWTTASAKNVVVSLFLRYAKLRAERELRRQFLDYVG